MIVKSSVWGLLFFSAALLAMVLFEAILSESFGWSGVLIALALFADLAALTMMKKPVRGELIVTR